MLINDLVIRINKLFEGIFGCSFEFQPTDRLDGNFWKKQDLDMMLTSETERPSYIEGSADGSYGFPLNLQGGFAGLIVVKQWKGVDPQQVLLLAEFLTLSVETSLRYEDRRERLQLIEERLRTMDEKSNVVPFRRRSTESSSQIENFYDLIDWSEPEEMPTTSPANPVTTLPLLIETSPQFPLRRVALEIHQLTNRWAFISVDDLPADIFDSRDSLKQLGAITLFIPRLDLLNTHQQLRLAEYLASQPGEDSPQIISGICDSPQHLVDTNRVLAHLTNSFCHAQLQWSEKSATQITSELINASLQHIVEQTRQSHQVGSKMIPFHIQYFDQQNRPLH